MIIKNIHISGFGQFNNRDFSFGPGINLITGHNESGKSTLNNFISHMLYGMNRSRGKASRNDDYSKYCPWDCPDSFGGSMRINAGETDYLIERSFNSLTKSLTITNEADGNQQTGNEAFLNRLTGGIPENAFNCTLNIKESGFNGGNDISGLIKKHILNIGCTASVNINVPLAIKSLNIRKKKLMSEIDHDARRSYYETEDKLASLNAELNKKRKDIEEQPLRCRQNISELERKNNLLSKETEQLQLEYEKLKAALAHKGFNNQSDIDTLEATHCSLCALISDTCKSANPNDIEANTADTSLSFKDIICGTLFSICLIIAIICFIMNFKTGGIIFITAGTATGIFAASSIIKRLSKNHIFSVAPVSERHEHLKKLSRLYGQYIGIYETTDYAKTLFINYISDIKSGFTRLSELKERIDTNKTSLSSNTDALYEIKNSNMENAKLYWESDNLQQQIDNLENELNRLKLILIENEKLKKEAEAYELAVSTIKNISADMHNEHAPEFNRRISQTFNQITGKNYGKLFISENMDITLNDGIRTIPAQTLSQGTIEQIYMSLRFSAASILFKEKEFPLIFDEAFSKYDNPRLAQTLRHIYLNHRGQTFIFSCQNRERLILEKLGIPFNYIKL